MCITNSKLKLKCVQAKAGEVLTIVEVMIRLKNESNNGNTKNVKTDKKKKSNEAQLDWNVQKKSSK